MLAHESPSDLCPWLPFAKTLADKGYRAFAFDFRGSGASAAQFAAKATRNDLDVVGAAAELRQLGAKKVFLVGGSFGGAAVMAAAPEVDPQPAGVISLSGEPDLLGAMQAAPRVKAPLLDLIARNDGYSSVADNRASSTRPLRRTSGSRSTRATRTAGTSCISRPTRRASTRSSSTSCASTRSRMRV